MNRTIAPLCALLLFGSLAASCRSAHDSDESASVVPQDEAAEASLDPSESETTEPDECGCGGSAEDATPAEAEGVTPTIVRLPDETPKFAPAPPDHRGVNVTMAIVRTEPNNIIDHDVWAREHPLGFSYELPEGAPPTYEGLEFRRTIPGARPVAMYGDGYSHRYFWTTDREGNEVLLDAHELRDGMMSLTHAARVGDVLFVNHSSRNSAESMNGRNGYVTAIDIPTGDVLWRSQPLVANSISFVVMDGVVFSGYGFTREDDFLYAIDAVTGEVIGRLSVPKMIDHIVFEDDLLHVRTYDRNLQVEVRVEHP